MSTGWGLLMGAVIPFWFVALYIAIRDAVRGARRSSGGKVGA